MRPDGYPWLWDQIDRPPDEGFRKAGNFTIDHFGDFVGQCLWMFQGWFSIRDEKTPDIIQLPFAIVPLKAGQKLTNVRTGKVYEIKKVLFSRRKLLFQDPPIPDTPESIKIPNRVWRAGFHPGEVVGCEIQITSKDGTFDLDRTKGDFLSIESSGRVTYRQTYAEVPDSEIDANHSAEPDPILSGYSIEWKVPRSEPGGGNSPFSGVNQTIKPERRPLLEITDKPDVKVNIEGQWFDNLVEFKLRGPTAIDTNLMTEWFEVFMDRYQPVLERLGFNRVLYFDRKEGVDPSNKMPEGGDSRRLRYFVRTERLWPGADPKLRFVDIQVKPLDKQE